MNRKEVAGILCFFSICVILVLLFVMLLAYADVSPVEVTVDEASLGRLALAAPGNGTPASISYNLSLAVAVKNLNWPMRVWRTAPLDAELRFGEWPFAVVRLAGAERDRIRPMRSVVYRVSVAAEGAPVALPSGAVAEFARESAAGVFKLELLVAGEVKYQAHRGRRGFMVRCPLKLSLPTAAAFARFERTPPQVCKDTPKSVTKTN